MAMLTVRNLPEEVHRALRARATHCAAPDTARAPPRAHESATIVGEPALTVGLGVGDPVKKTRSAKSWSCATPTIDFICRCGPIFAGGTRSPMLRRSERGCMWPWLSIWNGGRV